MRDLMLLTKKNMLSKFYGPIIEISFYISLYPFRRSDYKYVKNISSILDI